MLNEVAELIVDHCYFPWSINKATFLYISMPFVQILNKNHFI